MEKLFPFSPSEFQTILCGDQAPQWTKDDILNYTEPKLGYTRERQNIDCMNTEEKSIEKYFVTCMYMVKNMLQNLEIMNDLFSDNLHCTK